MKMKDSDQTWYFGCQELEEINDDGSVKDIQILKVGSFEHPQYGRIDITPDDLEAFKRSFDEKVRKIALAINYDHTKTVAAGWISDLSIQNEGTELWATPDWTDSGLKQVKGKEYRYFSAELAWKYKDAETGATHERVLLGGALTNYPFIKGMQVIEASETEIKPKGKQPMNLAEIKVALSEHGVDFVEMESKAKKHDALETELAETKVKLGEGETKLKLQDKKVTELSEELATVQKEKAEIKFNELKKKGMDEGKLTKEFADSKFKEVFEKMGAEFAEKMLADLPVAISNDFAGHGGEKTDKGKKADTKLNELAVAMSKKDGINFSEALDKVIDQNPELAEQLD